MASQPPIEQNSPPTPDNANVAEPSAAAAIQNIEFVPPGGLDSHFEFVAPTSSKRQRYDADTARPTSLSAARVEQITGELSKQIRTGQEEISSKFAEAMGGTTVITDLNQQLLAEVTKERAAIAADRNAMDEERAAVAKDREAMRQESAAMAKDREAMRQESAAMANDRKAMANDHQATQQAVASMATQIANLAKLVETLTMARQNDIGSGRQGQVPTTGGSHVQKIAQRLEGMDGVKLTGPGIGGSRAPAPIATEATQPPVVQAEVPIRAAKVVQPAGEVLNRGETRPPAGEYKAYTVSTNEKFSGNVIPKTVTFNDEGVLTSTFKERLFCTPSQFEELQYEEGALIKEVNGQKVINVMSGSDLMPFKQAWSAGFRAANVKALCDGASPPTVDMYNGRSDKPYKTITIVSDDMKLSSKPEWLRNNPALPALPGTNLVPLGPHLAQNTVAELARATALVKQPPVNSVSPARRETASAGR